MDCTPQPLGCQAGDVSVWCPGDLDVGQLRKAHGARIAEGVAWLGHCVYMGLADDARCRDTGRVPLKAEYLRNVIGRYHLDGVREAARNIGYVDRDPSYRAGSQSQTYWLLPPFDSALLIRRPITDAGLRHNVCHWHEMRRREMWQRIRRNETLVDRAVCLHLWQNLQRVRIDAAIDFGDDCHPAYQIAVEGIRRKEWRFKVDAFGRIHSNLTNLPRMLRHNLLVDGQRLANIDIGESQPLFVGLTLAQASNGRQADGKAGKRQAERQQAEGRGPSPFMMDDIMMDTHPHLEGGFDRKRLSADLRRYLELCEGRRLYRTVADRLGRTREEAKHGIMVVFYDKPWHRNEVSAMLDELFPAVMRDIRRLKQGDYRRLAHFAQRIESAFMFGRVVPRLMDLRPDLFLATIHDSILTTAGDAQLVRQVMLDEFAQLGLTPQVKVEPLGQGGGAGKNIGGRAAIHLTEPPILSKT